MGNEANSTEVRAALARPAAAGTFDLYALRFHFCARAPLDFPAEESANTLRGRFGAALRQADPGAYQRLFAPVSADGPSGLHDPPRPFVLRAAHLEGARFAPGQTFGIGVNLFDTREPAADAVSKALCAAVPAELVEGGSSRLLKLSFAAPKRHIPRVRVRFLTPTELKGAESPAFGVLFARIRDRVSTLRALYGSGPLPIDFAAMGARAGGVTMTRCELQHVERERVSRRTGERHSLGGFIGVAEYEGELAEFVAYLEAARWTGVGRQTVWGKGEIAWEEI